MGIVNIGIKEELHKVLSGTSFCTLTSIDQYIIYAEQHNLKFRYFPLLDCGLIILNGSPIILRTEEEGTTTICTQTTLF